MSELKSIRVSKNLTQKQAAELLGMSLRSYKDYENNPAKEGTLKHTAICQRLRDHIGTDEDHGLLTPKEIADACAEVLAEYDVRYAILFGSYAKGNPTEQSDVDLLIATDVTGLRFFGIAQRLRERMKKRIDLLNLQQLNNNLPLLEEVLKDGVKVYEQHET